MRIPSFIKQLASICDTASSRYALAGIECKSDGVTAKLTATDGRILASVHYPDDDSKKFDAIVDGKQLSAIPATAYRGKKESEKPVFDGTTLRYGGTTTTPTLIDGKFPRYEDVFDAIHDATTGYTVVKLDPVYLRTLCDLASVVGGQFNKGVTLFVKDATSCVFGYASSAEGYTARLAIMPLAADDPEKEHQFPPRPGEQPAEKPQPKPKRKKELVVQNCTVYPDGRRVPGETVNVTTGEVIADAPPPEMLDDDAIAAAVTREPDALLCSPAVE